MSKGDFMLTMGIDPGIAISGYGLVKKEKDRLHMVEYGAIRTKSGLPTVQRLKALYEGFTELIGRYKPDAIVVEELFFNKNAKTIITVGEARGIALLCASLANIEVFEYTPLQVKQAVVGYGRADKAQVQAMVKVLLNLNEIPKPDDAADALAAAICHIHTAGVLI